MKKWLLGGCGLAVMAIVALAAVVGIWLMSTYNGVVTADQNVDGAWSQVQNNLQRRADLVPNLVETVKGYAAHEREVFQQVADARGRLAGAASPREAEAANAGLTSALGRLLAIVENYPTLKADASFIRLQDELAGTENRLATARFDYNNAVRAFNTMIKTFPRNFAASLFGFSEREYFEADKASQEVPRVNF